MIHDYWADFYGLAYHHMFPLMKYLFKTSVHFLLVCLFYYWFQRTIYIFWNQVFFIRHLICKYLLQLIWLSFNFLNNGFWLAVVQVCFDLYLKFLLCVIGRMSILSSISYWLGNTSFIANLQVSWVLHFCSSFSNLF